MRRPIPRISQSQVISFRKSPLPLLAVCLMVAACGCGAGKPSDAELDAWMRDHHREQDASLTMESIELLGETKQADKSVKLEFQVHEQLKTDQFLPATLDEAFAEYQHDPSHFEQAKRTLAGLREPERSAAAASLPEPLPPLLIFRRTGSAGEKFTWNGTVIARKGESGWDFSEVNGQIDTRVISVDTVPRQELPQNAILLVPEPAENAVTQLVAKQNKLIQAVAAAEKSMHARLEREHQQLLAMITSNQVFEVSIPATSGPVQKLLIRFAHQENDGETIAVLFEDAANRLTRATWRGTLRLADAPPIGSASYSTIQGKRPTPDGWSIALALVDTEDRFPRGGIRGEIVFGIAADNQLMWFNQGEPIPLAVVSPAASLPDYKAYVSQVQTWTKPGQVWDGTIQYKGEVSRKIRLTFTQVRDGWNYARAVLETPTDDHAAATFEGTVTTSADGIFSWPVKLNWTSGDGTKFKLTQHEIPMITAGGGFRLSFSPAGECFGVSQSGGSLSPDITFSLKPSSVIADFQDAPVRWRNGLRANDRWSGTIVRGSQPAEKLSLTVCEVDEAGRSYRMTIHNPENPSQYRAFSGTLDDADGIVDGYALTVEPRSLVGPHTRVSQDGWWDIYGTSLDAKHRFRLSPDGKKLWGISGARELIQLVRDESRVMLPLDRASMAAAWQAACLTGNRWQGRLTNTEMKLSTDVEMKITSGVDANGNVEVELSIPKRPNTDMLFRGPLKLVDDTVNAYALVLQKQEQNRGQGASLVFGGSFRGIELRFRFTDDGKGLIGMATDSEVEKEFLELQKVEAAEK